MSGSSRRTRSAYDDVVLAMPVSVAYERYSTKPAQWWVAAALRELSRGSGIDHKTMDGLCLSSFTMAPDSAIGLTQHLGLSPRWLDQVPMGGVSGIVSVRRAARAVQAGDADVVACIAADTNHVDTFRRTLASFSRFAKDAVYPYGAGGANASFALIARHYMDAYGATREDFGKLAVSQRANALHNPNALMRKPLSLEQYMAARAICDPIHLFDCVMPCAGADGFLVMREDDARAMGLAYVHLRSTIERHNAHAADPVQTCGGWTVDIDELYQMASVRSDEIDVLQTYDDYPVISMMQLEDLGFCAKGEGAEFVREHSFTHDGTFPHNTSGGQLSVGQAGASGGHLGIVETIRQLLGHAGGRQVADARYGMASGFGMINYDRGLASGAMILERSNG